MKDHRLKLKFAVLLVVGSICSIWARSAMGDQHSSRFRSAPTYYAVR